MKPIRQLPRFLLALALLCVTARAGADEDKPPVKLTLHPAAEPRPALKYQLLPDFMDRIPGNAAVYYGKVTVEHGRFFNDQEWLNKMERWREAPLEELRADDVELPHGTIAYWLDRAARCAHCDWQLPVREEEFYAILLPELSRLRQFGRILATKARIHIARGQFDDAVATLQNAYSVGQHAVAGETLVNSLVGIMICSITSDQVMDLVQQPDSPNLYWALTALPRPLIDLRPAVEAEMHAVELSFPELRNLDKAEGTTGEWSERLHRFSEKLAKWSDDSVLDARTMVTTLSIRGYPKAKRGLIERGCPPDTVEAMPVGQVLLLYAMQTYEDLRDDIFKWFFVPYPTAREMTKAARKGLSREFFEGGGVLPIANVFLPGIENCRTAAVRTDREIAVLRVVEALRLYAAEHDGRLPEELSDTSVPVPDDPVTGQPFEYRVEGETAFLKGPSLPGVPLNYEVTMVRE